MHAIHFLCLHCILPLLADHHFHQNPNDAQADRQACLRIVRVIHQARQSMQSLAQKGETHSMSPLPGGSMRQSQPEANAGHKCLETTGTSPKQPPAIFVEYLRPINTPPVAMMQASPHKDTLTDSQIIARLFEMQCNDASKPHNNTLKDSQIIARLCEMQNDGNYIKRPSSPGLQGAN